MLDARFPAINIFTVSLHHSKSKVIDFLLDNDLIDIATSCRRPLDDDNSGQMQTSSAFGKSRSPKKI